MRIFGGFISARRKIDLYSYEDRTVPVCIVKPTLGDALVAAREASRNTFPISEGHYSHNYDLVENTDFVAVRPVEVPHD